MPHHRFAALGDNCIDRYLPPQGDWLVGGNAVNVAVQLARLGRSVSYFGAVGDDGAGTAVARALTGNGVDISGLRRIAGQATAHTDIETLPDGDRHFVFESFGACLHYRPDAAAVRAMRAMAHVHIGWLRGVRELRADLAGAGVVVSQDLSVNNAATELDPAGLDIAFSSAPPERGLVESQRLLALGAKCAVVMLGPAGCLASDGSRTLAVPATPAEVIDTTGAGDAFIAGFLDAYCKCLELKECLESGTAAGARACGHRGGFPQPPLQPIVHDTVSGSERLLEPD